jgi:membrane fusion protein, multidrug efflux system
MSSFWIKNNWVKNKSHTVNVILLVGIVAMLTACNKAPENTAQPAMPPMPVTVIAVQPTSVPMSVEAVAQTEGASEVEVRPRVGGIILKKLFEEGQPVKAGQVMFQIDTAPFQIALAQAKAQAAGQGARITQTNRETGRLKELLASQSISQREYDNATSDGAIAGASMMQAQASIKEAELNLSYTRVTAPSSGIAGRFLYSEGALAAANTSLLTTIVQISPIWVRFSLSESELQTLGGQANTGNVQEITLILANGQEYAQKGKLNFADSRINPSLGTQELRATFENTDKSLLPGQFVRARLTTGTREGVFLVPQAAVMTGDQGKFLYVVNAKNEATIRPVKVAEWQGGDWIVLEGLNTNDKVITDNLIKLRPGAAVKPTALGALPVLPAGAPAK